MQVAYLVESKTRILHLQAIDDGDRDSWVDAINHCKLNYKMHYKFDIF